MNRRRISTALSSLVTSGAMLLLAAAGALAGQDVPIVQPGAPGQKTTTLTAQQAVKLADSALHRRRCHVHAGHDPSP